MKSHVTQLIYTALQKFNANASKGKCSIRCRKQFICLIWRQFHPSLPTFPLPHTNTHTHTRPQLQAGCSCGISLLPSCRTRTAAAAAADEFLGSQLKRELQKALLQLQPHTVALAGTHTHTLTHVHSTLLRSTPHSTPPLAALDKLSTHIIYTFKRATLRHVELATRLRLAFYEFISVHLRPM